MRIRTLHVASLTTLSALAFSAFFAACSSDPAADNPKPTSRQDSGSPDSPVVLTDGGGLPDVGSCKSDASTCNSCYTPAQDPVNGCSPASANCIKFDNTRVPASVP